MSPRNRGLCCNFSLSRVIPEVKRVMQAASERGGVGDHVRAFGAFARDAGVVDAVNLLPTLRFTRKEFEGLPLVDLRLFEADQPSEDALPDGLSRMCCAGCWLVMVSTARSWLLIRPNIEGPSSQNLN
jgi:hypothetical protein